MTIVAIGDIHGCFRTLNALLQKISDEHSEVTLWCVGDLVNRGPDSLSVLRWARSQQSRLHCVLGNHDLHLLAYAAGVRPKQPLDTIDSVMGAADGDDLIEWLAHRPLLHRDQDRVMVHAGLLPQWTIEEAEYFARRLEQQLIDRDCRTTLLKKWRETCIDDWRSATCEEERDLLALSALTRMRVCSETGRMNLDFNGPLADVPPNQFPWFAVPNRKTARTKIVCGHWAMLGFHHEDNVLALDSGCHWGNSLSAVQLDNNRHFEQQNCED